jgi:large subunit ribosomal protein L18
MRTEQKQILEKKRRWRIRKQISGSAERPRMSVRFTGKNIHVQFIDDSVGNTLASITTLSKSLPDRASLGANGASAKKIGQLAAELAASKGIQQVVFDRSGARYHGKVKILAEAAREAGLKF